MDQLACAAVDSSDRSENKSERLRCLHSLFEERVDSDPHAIALICEEQTLTYLELELRANRLAHHLRNLGMGPGKFIGLYFDRGIEPIVAMLGTLKAGAAYVPLDPSYPEDRIRHILDETEAELLLTDSSLLAKAKHAFGGGVIALDTRWDEISSRSERRLSALENDVSPRDVSYVIYTSGTTGRPKGVVTEHQNAVRFVEVFNEFCGTASNDRVYQGFSLSFDGSIEEIWMAFSNGSALVVGTRDAPRFGNELAHYLSRFGVTYFSTVPTLLSTLTDPVPSLKLLIVSGEICSSGLVNRWARPGLRMLNVYGPTEATVNTTAAECVAGRPVTIGRPLRGYEIHILDPELRPVKCGEKGELFIGGKTLARGYFKRPELTAERFFVLPSRTSCSSESARLYRTGDLVRCNEQGELEFFGRIDTQVKIRGYRIELAEIETLLLEHENVRSACVKVVERDGLQTIAAYLLLKQGEIPIDRGTLFFNLESRLPSYMIPATLDILEAFPTLTSGKVDRSRLPEPQVPLIRQSIQNIVPEGVLEKAVASIWARVIGTPRISVEDDFFLDLGGHSLLAARMVTLLRNEMRSRVTVRDAYLFPTIRKLAAHLASIESLESTEASPGTQTPPAVPSSRTVFEGTPRRVRWATYASQAVSIYLLAGIAAAPLGLFYLLGLRWLEGSLSMAGMVGYGVMITLLAWPVLLTVAVAAKWLIIGRYKSGRYPLWSTYFFRWWLVNRIQALSGVGMLAGTPLLPFFFRVMGGRVGRGCTLDSALCSIWDLISIGDETSIGADTQLLGYRIEDGMLVIGSVEIGSRCFLGIHSALGLDVRMGDDSRLDDQSLLPDRGVIGRGVAMKGSPAQRGEVTVPESATLSNPGRLPEFRNARRNSVLYGAAHLVLLEMTALVFVLPTVPFLALWYFTFVNYGVGASCMALLFSVPAGVVLYCLYIAGLKRLVMKRATPGEYPVESLFYLRKWFIDDLIKLSRTLLLPVYTTLYLPPWLRLLGARIGARAELSTLWYFSPDLIDIGEESFFADGSIIGGKRFFRGVFKIGVNRIGRRSFVGNSAILPVGASLGDGCLLGVQSIPPSGSTCTPNGTEWLGSPSFALSNRPKIGNFDNQVTFKPSRKLYLQRAVIDGLRILIPGYLALGSAVLGVLALYGVHLRLGDGWLFALLPLIGLSLALLMILFVSALKQVVMGRFQPVIRPLWSMYVWLNEMVNGAYESVMAPALMPFLGTPFVASLLRLLGCKIGRGTYIDTTLFSEFDLVRVGDYAALNVGAVIQCHLFEDRIMKSSHVKIGDECSVGNMAVVLYDSEMQEGASIGPLSLVMKGEVLSPHTRWHGIPILQVTQSSPPLELQGLPSLGLTRTRPVPAALEVQEAR